MYVTLTDYLLNLKEGITKCYNKYITKINYIRQHYLFIYITLIKK